MNFPDPIWKESKRVRIDSKELGPGDRFRCIQGQQWTLVRQDSVSPGVFHARRDDGFETVFAGCAEAVPACPACGALCGTITDHDMHDGWERCRQCMTS